MCGRLELFKDSGLLLEQLVPWATGLTVLLSEVAAPKYLGYFTMKSL